MVRYGYKANTGVSELPESGCIMTTLAHQMAVLHPIIVDSERAIRHQNNFSFYFIILWDKKRRLKKQDTLYTSAQYIYTNNIY